MSQRGTVRTYGRKARKPPVGKMPLAEVDTNLTMSTATTKGRGTDARVKRLSIQLKDVSLEDEKKKSSSRQRDVLPTPKPRSVSPDPTPVASETKPLPSTTESLRIRTEPVAPRTTPVASRTKLVASETKYVAAGTRLVPPETTPLPSRTKQVEPRTKSLASGTKQVPAGRNSVPPETPKRLDEPRAGVADAAASDTHEDVRVLSWEDVCPVGDRIEKIAEASYAEVYRITNERGTSIIKVIRLESPIKPQTKAQEKSGLVDEDPRYEEEMAGELQISELLADIPGFVIYKEKYTVQGKTTPGLLETHQSFHRKMKRKDPDRLQFYPSPSRYLNETKFLVVELGDAGTALEDLEILTTDQIWDVFLHVAVALARAENLIRFEHRDLHEGNVCVKEVAPPSPKTDRSPCRFGYSGLDVTILDYGLSRAEDTTQDNPVPISHDLEKDLSLFTSTHAKQCRVYRQMRSYILKGDRIWIPPKYHSKPYEKGINGRISWRQHHAYTNVLWLAYLYEYLIKNFRGGKKELAVFRRETQELWAHMDPEAPAEILSFSSAEDIVEFAVEAGWITEEQLVDMAHEGYSQLEGESIIEIRPARTDDTQLRRTPRRRSGQPLAD